MNNTQPFFRLDYGGKLEREIAYLLALFEEIKFDSGRIRSAGWRSNCLKAMQIFLSVCKPCPAAGR
jgi:hypothetical protein